MTIQDTLYLFRILIRSVFTNKMFYSSLIFTLLFFANLFVQAQCDGLGTGSNNGAFDISGTCQITGDVTITGGSNNDLIIRNGATLIIDGDFTNDSQGSVTVEVGGYFEVTGTYDNGANAGTDFEGEVVVGENFLADGNNAEITVEGSLNVTGNLTTTGNSKSDFTVNGGGIVRAQAIDIENDLTVNDGGTIYAPNGITAGTTTVDGSNPDTDCTNNCCGSLCNDVGNALNDDGFQALPVALISFEVQIEPDKITLTWQTASELNNDYFTLEKSTDGIQFFELVKIQGSGTTSTMTSYTFEDYDVSGVTYYRLSQTDFDGTHEVLDALRVGETFQTSSPPSCYPNPLIETRTLTVNDVTADMSWQLFDLSGSLVSSGDFLVSNQIDLNELKAGTFLLKTNRGNEFFMKRIIVK